MHLPKNLEMKERTKERGIWGETLFHGKRKWWGTIPPVGIRGERPEMDIRRGSPAPFLSRRERGGGERNRRMGMGELELPLPVLIPTGPNRCGSTAYHCGSTARAEVPHRGSSTAQPGGSKKLLPRGDGSTVLPQAVVPWLAAVVP